MLGSLVVFVTGAFAIWTGVSDGYAALVFVQAQAFADATRYLVRSVQDLVAEGLTHTYPGSLPNWSSTLIVWSASQNTWTFLKRELALSPTIVRPHIGPPVVAPL
jgi:hypothetical protein